jgi:uracil-DNA glycosylase family 4
MTTKAEQWDVLERRIESCRRCPRLVIWREKIARQRRRAYQNQDYWGKPVPGFGDHQSRVLIVGLAPGAHGANRTGRMFTGDGSGSFLFHALHQAGFANQPAAVNRGDSLQLKDVFITAVCRCAPPGNRPNREEIDNCLVYLGREIELLPDLEGIVVLGKIAFDNTLRWYRQTGHDISGLEFTHGAVYELGRDLPWMVVSYHPSRQNTQTGRLTQSMFAEIWQTVKSKLNQAND